MVTIPDSFIVGTDSFSPKVLAYLHAKLTFTEVQRSIKGIDHIYGVFFRVISFGFLWSLDHPQTNSGPLIPFSVDPIKETVHYTWLARKTHFWRSAGHQPIFISRLWDWFRTTNSTCTKRFNLWLSEKFLSTENTGEHQIALKARSHIWGTEALQFVTFWKFLSFTENTGEHRSKGIDHIYGVQIWWSTIFPRYDFS